jgi:hypothetical protein
MYAMPIPIERRDVTPKSSKPKGYLDTWLDNVRALHDDMRRQPERQAIDVDAMLDEFKNRYE